MSRRRPDWEKFCDTTRRVWDRRRGNWYSTPSLSAGLAKRILSASGPLTGMSKVNRSLTKQQAFDVLSGSVSELRDDEALHHLHARNIVVEFWDTCMDVCGDTKGGGKR